MASVDPYSSCPCGSGQKFKWCCHKVEAQVERVQRLYDSGQHEAAIRSIDESLRSSPGTPWLLMRKAAYLIDQEMLVPAKEALEGLLKKSPTHLGAIFLLTRLDLEIEGAAAGAATFQRAISLSPPEEHPKLSVLAQVVGVLLQRSGFNAAAIRHLQFAVALAGEESKGDALHYLQMVESSRTVPPWVKNPYQLTPPPEGLDAHLRERFEQAMTWADQGQWAAAAASFEMLSADAGLSTIADRNLGLCRLWIADSAGAVEALRRAIAGMGATTEAVDLAGLCQMIAIPAADDLVEQVQLIWPLRDREGLLKALRADARIEEGEPGPIDPDDPNSPQVDQFELFDRPLVEKTVDLQIDEVPLLLARIVVGTQIAVLDAYDDGRLDELSDRFRTLAGAAIAPAHPKTKVVHQIDREAMSLSWQWRLPEALDPEEGQRLQHEQAARQIGEVWPGTPLPYLKGRTLRKAAAAGDAVVPLRAAFALMEDSYPSGLEAEALATLRASLNVEPEPPVDPETVDIERLHLARLNRVPADRLDDHRLAALNKRARRYSQKVALDRSSRVLVDRPDLWEREEIDVLRMFADLALLATENGRHREAFEWIDRGRRADPSTLHRPVWDMVELRVRAHSEPPEQWVPVLSMLLERYSKDQESMRTVMLNLMDMGLAQAVPHPERPGEVLLDTRVLQMFLAEYGPRITTAAGELGVSATRGGLWTPGSAAAGGGGAGGAIWTPGSESPPPASGPEKSRLIVPGR